MSRRHLFHPRRRRLLEWMEAEEVSSADRLTAHLETCSRCARRLDELVLGDAEMGRTAGVVAPSGETDERLGGFAAAVRDAWSVPDELPVRIHRAIDRRARVDRELDLLLGLVSISKDTAELLLPSDEDEKENPS